MRQYLDVQHFADYLIVLGWSDWLAPEKLVHCAPERRRSRRSDSSKVHGLGRWMVPRSTIWARTKSKYPVRFKAANVEESSKKKGGFISFHDWKIPNDTNPETVVFFTGKYWVSQSILWPSCFTHRNQRPTFWFCWIARWDTLNTFIQSAVVGESARWGDSRKALGGSYAVTRTRDVDWQNEVNVIRNLPNGNRQKLIKELVSAGLYTNLQPPTFSPKNQQ
jgi:hypothetical protein